MAARITSWVLRLGLAAIFLYAGFVKVWDLQKRAWATPDFLNDILSYHLLPWYPAMALASYLPWLEMAAGAAVLGRRWRQGALLLMAVLLSMFLAALTSAAWRGLDISCGCFGHENASQSWEGPLWRDLAFLAAVAGALWLEGRGRKSEVPPSLAKERPLG